MINNKLSPLPPKIAAEQARDEFIAGAEKPVINSKYNYPWENGKARPDLNKPCTINLPETYVVKLKYLSEKTLRTQQKIARDLLCKGLDSLIEELNK
jgi:hypothetical protein